MVLQKSLVLVAAAASLADAIIGGVAAQGVPGGCFF